MIRVFNTILILLAVASATWTYQVKHESELRLAEIRKLERQIALEKQTLELLRADWAHLSHPQRLQMLVELYGDELGLDVPASDRLITVEALPGPPQFDLGDAVGDIIAGEPDSELTTGSIDEGGQ